MRLRFRAYLCIIGIIALLTEMQLHVFSNGWEQYQLNRFRYLAQFKTKEYRNSFLGVEILQYPNDLMAYSDLIYRLKPDFVIETGTNKGGLTIYLAMLLERTNPDSRVITVDIDSRPWMETVASGKIPSELKSKIAFIEGDSTSIPVIAQIEKYASGKKCLVILDSLHSREHVLKELRIYSKFIPPDGYVIVNDTHLEILGVIEGFIPDSAKKAAPRSQGPFAQFFSPHRDGGPLAAVQEFILENKDFQIDSEYPRSMISCAPSGFLKKTKSS